MRGILIGLSLALIALPAQAAPKCNKIIGKSVHVTGKITGVARSDDGEVGYVVLTAATFPYCNSIETVVFAGKGEISCKEGQEINADGPVVDTYTGMGGDPQARVQARTYSCK